MMLPNDPNLLLCIINTKLRDRYSNLEDLCEDLDVEIDEIDRKLNAIGYYYDSNLNQFKYKND